MGKQKRIFDSDKIYTKHIRTQKFGGVTICGRWDQSLPATCRFEIGVGFCSPEEANFNKKLGRMIATGRLKTQRMRGYSQIDVPEVDTDLTWEWMVEALNKLAYLGTEVDDHYVPRWFKEFLYMAKASGKFNFERADKCQEQ